MTLLMPPTKNYWLMKTEPGCYSIDHLKRDKKTFWSGVRNFQARNFMRDKMEVGDEVLFYHSNAEPSGVAGLAAICKKGYPDFTAWDPKDQHFDPKSPPEKPLWYMVDIKFVKRFPNFISLTELKNHVGLKDMMVVQRGSRLSVQPVNRKDFEIIKKMGG